MRTTTAATLSFLSLCLSPSGALPAQVPPTPVPPAAAWAQFQRDHGQNWSVEWNTATGTPEAIFGGGLLVAPAGVHTRMDATACGDLVLARHADLLGSGASTFVPQIVEPVGPLWVLVYEQRHFGLRVIGGRADVRVRNDGRVVLFGTRAVPMPVTFDRTPRVDATEAIANAYAHSKIAPPRVNLQPLALPEVVVWAALMPGMAAIPHLAWAVRVASADGTQGGVAYVDARTGTVLQWHDEVHTCGAACAHEISPLAHARALRESARGRIVAAPKPAPAPLFNVSGNVRAFVNQGTTPTSPLTEVPLGNIRLQVVNGGTYNTSDTTGSFDIPTNTQDPTITVDFFLDGRHLAGLTNAAGTTLTRRVVFTNPSSGNIVTFGSAGSVETERAQTTTAWHIDDVNRWTRTVLHGNSRLDTLDAITATVNDSSQTCNAYYVANTVRFLAQSATCANSAYGSVIQHEWGHGLDDVFGGISTNDGLSEGNADIVAMFRGGNAVIGDGFFRDNRIPNRLRTGLNTRRYPTIGSVHDMGEVWMGFAWDMRTRLMARWGAAAGKGRAEVMFFGSIVADAESLRAAVREVFVLDDDDADLCNGTPSYADLSAACDARDIPYPGIPCLPDATFIPLGPGCPGTGVEGVCLSANSSATSLTATPTVPAGGRYAFPMLSRRPIMLAGLSVRTRSLGTGAGSATMALHAADASGQPGVVVAGPFPVPIPTAEDWRGAFLSPPVPMTPGITYFMVFDTTASPEPIAVPQASAGNDAECYYTASTSAPWAGPLVAPFAWRVYCTMRPGAVPYLSARTLPRIGESFVMLVHGARPSTIAVIWLGASDTMWGAFPLPLDLGPFGAMGCPVSVSWDVSVFASIGSEGSLELALGIPDDTSLAGAVLFSQASVVDFTANRLGLVTSNGAKVTIGD